jgi:excisionase family DNA binding protein
MGVGVETYFTIEGIAKYLNYAEKTIRKWVLNREIPFIRIHQTIRFRLSEIEVWVEKNKVRPASDENEVPEGELFSEVETEQDVEDIETIVNEADIETAEIEGEEE